MPLVVDQINDMIKAGVPIDQVNKFKEDKLLEMKQGNVPLKIISEQFGQKEVDRTDIQKFWQSIYTEVEKDVGYGRILDVDQIPDDNAPDRIQKFLLGNDERYQFKPSFERALGNSGLNKMIKYHSDGQWGYKVDQPLPEGTGFLEKLTEGAVGLVAEIPTFIPGAVAGTFVGGPGGAVIGGGFSAGAIQGIYSEALKRGEVKGFSEWWDIFVEEGLSEGAKTAAKLYAAYKAPALLPFTNPIVNNIVGRTLTQSTAYTATGVAMGEDMPTAEDFAVTSLLFAPFNIKAPKSKLDNVVAKTGKKPIDIIEDVVKDRTIWEDLNSKNIETPRAYRDIALEKTIEQKIKELKEQNKKIYKDSREQNNLDRRKVEQEVKKKNPNISMDEMYRMVDSILAERTNKKIEPIINQIKELESQLKNKQEPLTKEQFEKADKVKDETRNELDKSISYETKERIWKTENFIDDLFYNLIDQNHVYKRAEKKAEKYGVKYEENISPYENFQLLHGVKNTIQSFIERGAMDFKTDKVIGPSMKKIFIENNIKDLSTYKDFIRYSISKRAIEKNAQKLETGVNIKAAEKFVKENKQFEKPFRDIVKVSELSLKYLLDAGVISKEVYQAALKANKDFVPFYRDFLEEAGSGNFSKNVRNPLKFFKGSKKKIIDPFESIYNNIGTFVTIAKRNEANLSFLEMIEQVRKVDPNAFPEVQISPKRTKETKISAKELEQVVENPKSLKPEVVDGFSVFRKESGYLKDTEIVVYRNGKREVWEVGEAFARPTKTFEKGIFRYLADFFSLPSRTLRAGATGAAEFVYNNVSRDAFSSAILSKGWYVPYFQTLMGISMVLKPTRKKFGLDKVYEEYSKSPAVQNSIVTLDRTYFDRTVKEYFTKTRPINYIKNIPELFRIYVEFSEKVNRAGNFKLALDRNLKRGLSEDQAIKKSAVETRDNPIDYRRMGASIQGLNQISAFFNARIQGLNQTIKAFKDRPLQTYAKVFMYVQLPSILLWMANHDDPDYQDLPQWRKDLFWHIKVNGTYYPIPKPFEIGLIFGTGTERFLDYYFDKDPKAIEKFKDAVTVQSFKGLVPFPDILKPFFEAKNNRSFFFDRPIIPAGLENVPSEYQYTDYTSETMKLIASLIRKVNGDDFSKASSPLVLENAWRGWSGGIGGYILQLSDSLLDAVGIVDRSKNRKKMLSEYPVIKALIIKNPDRNAEPITDFRKLYEPVMKRINAKRILEQKGEIEKAKIEQEKLPKNWVVLERAYKALQVQEQIIRNINEDPKESPEAKLHMTNIMIKEMIREAKHAINLYYDKEVYTIKVDKE